MEVVEDSTEVEAVSQGRSEEDRLQGGCKIMYLVNTGRKHALRMLVSF